jgi:hypothetical protein
MSAAVAPELKVPVEPGPYLADRQHAFGRALLDPARPVPWGVVGPSGSPSTRRFNVYRNNVVAGLASTLKDAYPVVMRIVGEEFFTAMAVDYVRGHPPDSPMMFAYGAGFAEFIASFDPVRELIYLPDVARIERAWAEAYHAREAEPLHVAHLAAVGADDRLEVCFTLHPSLRVVCSPYPASTIWAMNVEGGVLRPVDIESGGEDVIIMRPKAEVEVRTMLPGCAAFLAALARGHSLMDSTRLVLEEEPEFDLMRNLVGLMESGAFVEWRLGGQVATAAAREKS